MVVDVFGQIALTPVTEWGRASRAPRTTRSAQGDLWHGNSNGSDAFDPAVEWDGFPVDMSTASASSARPRRA